MTGAAYMHEFLVMPCRTHVPEDADWRSLLRGSCGRRGRHHRDPAAPDDQARRRLASLRATDRRRASSSSRMSSCPGSGSSWAGETEEAGFLTTSYATHHRQTCIAARAGFGDLLIGAGALMSEANGLDPNEHGHIRDQMVELIKIVEGFFACGVASSIYCVRDGSGIVMPDPVFANVGKLLLATQIYEMHRIAHYVSGGMVVALPGPEEDHNPETAASLSAILGARADIPYDRRMQVARFVEDLTVSDQAGWYSVISLHGGGSPEAMKREIWRNYPVEEKKFLVETLLDRGVARCGPALVEAARPVLASPVVRSWSCPEPAQHRNGNAVSWGPRRTDTHGALTPS